jgi:glucan phosphoethanolaminetransferase (alkaline phosphatase superfamily)
MLKYVKLYSIFLLNKWNLWTVFHYGHRDKHITYDDKKAKVWWWNADSTMLKSPNNEITIVKTKTFEFLPSYLRLFAILVFIISTFHHHTFYFFFVFSTFHHLGFIISTFHRRTFGFSSSFLWLFIWHRTVAFLSGMLR